MITQRQIDLLRSLIDTLRTKRLNGKDILQHNGPLLRVARNGRDYYSTFGVAATLASYSGDSGTRQYFYANKKDEQSIKKQLIYAVISPEYEKLIVETALKTSELGEVFYGFSLESNPSGTMSYHLAPTKELLQKFALIDENNENENLTHIIS